MEFILYHPQFGFMKTEYELMRGRKIAQGWRDYEPEKENILLNDNNITESKPIITIRKRRGRPPKSESNTILETLNV